MRSAPFAIAVAALLASSCDKAPLTPSVSVENAWVRLPAVKGRPGAAYFTLGNEGAQDRLVSVTSAKAERAELHDSVMKDGMMAMAPLDAPTIAAREKLAFEPGGKHVMLFGIAPDAEVGGTIPLTFTFEAAPAVTVEAKLVAAGDEEPGHEDH
jgi:copper(I)-binding protein